jgi:hypothetical protein
MHVSLVKRRSTSSLYHDAGRIYDFDSEVKKRPDGGFNFDGPGDVTLGKVTSPKKRDKKSNAPFDLIEILYYLGDKLEEWFINVKLFFAGAAFRQHFFAGRPPAASPSAGMNTASAGYKRAPRGCFTPGGSSPRNSLNTDRTN